MTSPGMNQYDDSDIPTHSEAIEGLPDIGGYGRVYGLRDAIALDDATDAEGNSRLTAPYYSNSRTETRSLREMVEAFKETNADGSSELDKTAREALAVKILLRWAGAEGAVGRIINIIIGVVVTLKCPIPPLTRWRWLKPFKESNG